MESQFKDGVEAIRFKNADTGSAPNEGFGTWAEASFPLLKGQREIYPAHRFNELDAEIARDYVQLFQRKTRTPHGS